MFMKILYGEIVESNLPKKGTLSDGSTVSNYHLLDDQVLKAEGWLPVEEIKPEYNQEIEYLFNPQYEIQEDKVIKTWQVTQIINEPQEPQIDHEKLALYEAIAGLQERLEALEGGNE